MDTSPDLYFASIFILPIGTLLKNLQYKFINKKKLVWVNCFAYNWIVAFWVAVSDFLELCQPLSRLYLRFPAVFMNKYVFFNGVELQNVVKRCCKTSFLTPLFPTHNLNLLILRLPNCWFYPRRIWLFLNYYVLLLSQNVRMDIYLPSSL